MIDIDGSVLEGGGAILRIAAGLSAITGQPVRIYKIRAGRKKPGLMTQHLESLKAVATLCSGRLNNAVLGSTEIELYPGKMQPRQIDVEIGTAGSVGLLFQSIAAPLCRADGEITISIHGGATFGKWAPPLLATKHVLLPLLGKMGYAAEIEILRHGFFPRGGASVRINGYPCKTLQPLTLLEPGEVRIIRGISVASNHLQKAQVADRQAHAAREALARTGLESKIEYKYVDAACPGSGIVLWAETTAGAIVGGDSTGERGKPSEQVGEEAAAQILDVIQKRAAVDEHISDQVLIFMALARGLSAITAPKFTDHAKTNIHIIKQFLPVDFQVQETGNVRIECSGFAGNITPPS